MASAGQTVLSGVWEVLRKAFLLDLPWSLGFYLLTRVLPIGLRLSVLTHQDGDGVAVWASRDPVDRQSGFAVEVGERTRWQSWQ